MVSEIITELNTRLTTQTNYFREAYGLARFVKSGDVTYPALYCGNGEYKNVSDFDMLNGSCYWRKSGAITSSPIDNTSTVSSKKMVRLSIPLRLVGVVKRELMTEDSPYNSDILARSVFAVLNKNLNGNIRQTIGARAIYLDLNSIDDDIRAITKAEFDGLDQEQINDSLVVFAINITIGVEIRQDCIGMECDE